MPCLKCLVCNNRIDNNVNNDSSQLFKTVCSLLDLDSDLDNFILNSPLTIQNAFCDDCQVIAAKLFNLQTSLIEIQQSIKTTIATITKTILQTQTQTQQEEQEQKGKNEKRKNIFKIPCEDGSKLISKLRKIIYARFSPVVKLLSCHMEMTSSNTNKNTTRTSERRRIKTGNEDETEFDNDDDEDNIQFYDDDDVLHDDGNKDVDYDPFMDMDKSVPSKKPRHSSSATSSTPQLIGPGKDMDKDSDSYDDDESKSPSNPDSQLMDGFLNVDEYTYSKIVWEKPSENAPPEPKEIIRWKCPKCPSTVGRGTELRRHFNKFHGPKIQRQLVKPPKSKPIPDKPGHFIYAEKWEYEMKEDPEGGGIIVTCLTCDFKCKTKPTMTKHIGRHHNFTPKWPCSKCKKSFLHETVFKTHRCVPKKRQIEDLTKELPDGSFIYDDKFPFVKIEDNEADVDSSGFSFKCCTCNAKRKLYKDMVAHMKNIHANPKGSLCSECGRVFTEASSLKTHMEMMHTSEVKYMCDMCGRPCKTKTSLREHKLRVHSEAIFKCPQEGCDKVYSYAPSLRKHFRRTGHSLPSDLSWDEPQIVSCSRCDTKFRSVRAVKTHELSCNGIKKGPRGTKRYSCRECQETFYSFQLCREHEFSHVQERQASLSLPSSAATTTTTITTDSNDFSEPFELGAEATITTTTTTTTSCQNAREETETATNQLLSVMNEIFVNDTE